VYQISKVAATVKKNHDELHSKEKFDEQLADLCDEKWTSIKQKACCRGTDECAICF